jgi:hypothetical protein
LQQFHLIYIRFNYYTSDILRIAEPRIFRVVSGSMVLRLQYEVSKLLLRHRRFQVPVTMRSDNFLEHSAKSDTRRTEFVSMVYHRVQIVAGLLVQPVLRKAWQHVGAVHEEEHHVIGQCPDCVHTA